MAKITQYSRISHHTIAGSASAGLTFSIPPQEDFTDGSWTPYDLALSEIGVNEQDEKVFIRIDDTIKEFAFIGASGVGFTGGSGNCITDLYLTNMYGCSPITIHDNFIQKDGTSVNSEDGKLQITFDDTGEGVMTISKTGGTDTDLDRLTVGNAGIQMQTSNSVDTTSATIVVESINGAGNDLGIVLANVNSINNNSSQISIADSTTVELLTNKGGGTTNQILLNSVADVMNITTTSNGGEIASIDLAYDPIGNETSITLRTEDNSFTEVSSITMTKDGISLFSTDDTISINDGCGIGIEPNVGVALRAAREVFTVTPDNLVHGTTNVVTSGTNAIYYHLEKLTTTNATASTLYSIPFPQSGTVITIKAIINGSENGGGDVYGAEIFGVFKNLAGTVTLISTLDKSEKTDFATATTDLVISGTNIIIEVTGEAATTINWVTRFNYIIS